MPGCGQSDKSKILEQYKYDEYNPASNEIIKKKLGSWVNEGIFCYGIVIVHGENGLPIRAKEVYAKIIDIQDDKIVMRSLEDVVMSPELGCVKYSLRKGDDWNEVEGDLFRTREETIRFIDTNYPGLRMKDKIVN